ncbi:hypothetical protein J6590_077053 [Homalodisca vitripennis]|nr:hypothetical protein J6590_077053 [Homalodisca vitripennis]
MQYQKPVQLTAAEAVHSKCREAARSRGRYRPGWFEGYLLFAERAAVAKRKSAQNTSRTGPFKISGGVALIGTADD